MARLLSNIILKGMGGYPVANSSSIISSSSYHNGKRYFSTDRNENFEGSSLFSDPNDNFEGSSLFLKRLVEQDVKENPVMIYMKGVPEFPYCGFSSLALRLLRLYNVPISARNIFEDPEIIHAIRDHSSWPTFPQIFIKGEFIGGSDIILNMHLNGELKEKLKDIAVSEESK